MYIKEKFNVTIKLFRLSSGSNSNIVPDNCYGNHNIDNNLENTKT